MLLRVTRVFFFGALLQLAISSCTNGVVPSPTTDVVEVSLSDLGTEVHFEDSHVHDAIDTTTLIDSPQLDTPLVIEPGLTSDFRTWLSTSDYRSFDFARDDIVGGSYGGRTMAGQTLQHRPIVFVHGNSDRALGGSLGGFTDAIQYFRERGYGSHELYATTWGPADSMQATQQYHSRAYVSSVRGFFQAVLAYTQSDQIDIVSHSMGVTLSRKAILGGSGSDALDGGAYNLGAGLTNRVNTFVGIAGANLGLTGCYFSGPSTPTCGSTNGFYPGQQTTAGIIGRSLYLNDLLMQAHFEGQFVYSYWSTQDELIGFGNVVWGNFTSQIPGQDGERRDTVSEATHLALKSRGLDTIFLMVTEHRTQ